MRQQLTMAYNKIGFSHLKPLRRPFNSRPTVLYQALHNSIITVCHNLEQCSRIEIKVECNNLVLLDQELHHGNGTERRSPHETRSEPFFERHFVLHLDCLVGLLHEQPEQQLEV